MRATLIVVLCIAGAGILSLQDAFAVPAIEYGIIVSSLPPPPAKAKANRIKSGASNRGVIQQRHR